MRALLAVIIALMAGCAASPTAPIVQPPGPTSPTAVSSVIARQDSVDSKVAAAVTVAKDNADKPAIVRSELGVALSFLAAPAPGDLLIARARSTKATEADYAAAVKAAKNMAADLDAAQAQLKANQEQAAKASALKDARIAELTAENARLKAEGPRNMVLAVAAACFLAALGLGVAGQYVRAGIAFGIGTLTAALPLLFDSKWFIPTLGGILIAAIVAEAVAIFWQTRKPSFSDAQPPSN